MASLLLGVSLSLLLADALEDGDDGVFEDWDHDSVPDTALTLNPHADALGEPDHGLVRVARAGHGGPHRYAPLAQAVPPRPGRPVTGSLALNPQSSALRLQP